MKLYIAENLENEYCVGVFTSIELALEECNKIAIRDDVAPEWKSDLNDELPQWCGYQHERMTFYIQMRYLNNEAD
jgi:hypothetical protein